MLTARALPCAVSKEGLLSERVNEALHRHTANTSPTYTLRVPLSHAT